MGCGKSNAATEQQPESRTQKDSKSNEPAPVHKTAESEARNKDAEKEIEMKKKENQLAGGHTLNFKFLPDGTLMKKTSPEEIAFFKEITDPKCKYYAERQAIDKFIPKFHAVETIDGAEWLKMENCTFGLTFPSYIDVKMGTQTWGPDYPEKKMKRHMEVDKTTTSSTLGLKVSGVVIKDRKGENSYKLFKDSLKAEEIPGAFKKLLSCNDAEKPNAAALDYYIAECEKILEFFEKVNKRYFIAASLFFVLSNIDNKYALKLIDFAHVQPIELMNKEKDDGFIFGMKTMIKILKEAGGKA